MTWFARAKCAGHPNREWWFSSDPDDIRDAAKVCAGCPVRAECARAGEGEVGMWGGVYRSEKGARQRHSQFRCEKCHGLFIRADGSVARRCDACLSAADLRKRRDRERQRFLRKQARENATILLTSGARDRLRDPDPVPDPGERIEMAERTGSTR